MEIAEFIHEAHSRTGVESDLDYLKKYRSFEKWTGQDALSDYPSEILEAIKDGSYKKGCFICIMMSRYTTLGERQVLLKALMNDSNFLDAKTLVWQEIQFAFINGFHKGFVMEPIAQSFGYDEVLHFIRYGLLADVMQACAHIIHLEKKDEEIFFPLWKCVSFYCLTIAHQVLIPHRLGYCPIDMQPNKDLMKMALRGAAEKNLLQAIVKRLHTGDIYNAVRSVKVLRWLIEFGDSNSPSVLRDHEDLIPVLVRLFKPGAYQRCCADKKDKGFPLYQKFSLIEGVRLESQISLLENANDDVAFERLLLQVETQTDAGAVLTMMIENENKMQQIQLVDQPHLLSAVMNWLKRPYVRIKLHHCVMTTACAFMRNLSSHPMIGRTLLETCDLLSILRRQLLCPSWFVVWCAICTIKNLLKTQGAVVADRILDDTDLWKYVCFYLHCSLFQMVDLQNEVLEVVLILCRRNKVVIEYLYSSGIFIHATADWATSDMGEMMKISEMRLRQKSFQKLAKMCQETLEQKWRSLPLTNPSAYLTSDSNDLDKAQRYASKLITKKNYKRAIEVLWYPARYNIPDSVNIEIVSMLAFCYLKTKRYDEALKYYTICLSMAYEYNMVTPIPQEAALKERSLKLIRERAEVFEALDMPFEAVSDLAVYIDKNPDDAHAKASFDRMYEKYKKLGDGTLVTLQKCDQCGLENEGWRKCSRCNRSYFCSKTCQKKAWPKHKTVCHK